MIGSIERPRLEHPADRWDTGIVPDDVAIVRSLLESTQRRDAEAITRLLDPDLVWEAPPMYPGSVSKSYNGPAGYLELMAEVGSEGDAWVQLLDVEPLGPQEVLATAVMGTAKRGGMRAFLRFAVVDGRVSRARTFFSRDEAVLDLRPEA